VWSASEGWVAVPKKSVEAGVLDFTQAAEAALQPPLVPLPPFPFPPHTINTTTMIRSHCQGNPLPASAPHLSVLAISRISCHTHPFASPSLSF